MKKIAVFVFAAAAALSASLAVASVDCEQCYWELQSCRDFGNKPKCIEVYRQCLRTCTTE